MSLDTYTNLQAEVADWMNRSDLTLKIPTFIVLAESMIKRDLRRTTAIATLTVTTAQTQLPDDVAELRSLKSLTGLPSQSWPIIVGTYDMLSDAFARHAGVAGQPKFAAVLGKQLFVAPAPDQPYDLEAVYFQSLVPLSGSNATNVILTEFPDIYLWATLLIAEPFLENDSRAGMWKAAYDAAISAANLVREKEEFGSQIKQARMATVY